MSNFKSGSGNLDFSDGDGNEEKEETTTEGSETPDERNEGAEGPSSEGTSASQSDGTSADTQNTTDQPPSSRESAHSSAEDGPSRNEYPYFVRRNNVGDERETRLEIHVRDKVADREAEFRNELAEHLETSEVSKTDAREFALLAAFDNPEQVAELMRDEGHGTL